MQEDWKRPRQRIHGDCYYHHHQAQLCSQQQQQWQGRHRQQQRQQLQQQQELRVWGERRPRQRVAALLALPACSSWGISEQPGKQAVKLLGVCGMARSCSSSCWWLAACITGRLWPGANSARRLSIWITVYTAGPGSCASHASAGGARSRVPSSMRAARSSGTCAWRCARGAACGRGGVCAKREWRAWSGRARRRCCARRSPRGARHARSGGACGSPRRETRGGHWGASLCRGQ